MAAKLATNIGLGALIATNAYLMTQDLPDADQTRETFENQGLDADKLLGSKDDWMSNYDSDYYDNVSKDFNTSTGERDYGVSDYTPGAIDFSGSGSGSGKSDKSAEQAVKEISEINKQMSDLQQKASRGLL